MWTRTRASATRRVGGWWCATGTPSRGLTTGAGPIESTQPRVTDRRVDVETRERVRFGSSIIPPWWVASVRWYA